MKLNEFVDKNGNKVNIKNSGGNQITSGNSSTGFYKRLRKLLNYHINHKDKDVDRINQNDVRNFGFDYIEHHKGQFEGGYYKKVSVRISEEENWYLTVYMDNKQLVDKVGKGWDKLVYELSFRLSLPQDTKDPEYQDLLEWVDKSGNKITLPNKSSSKATRNIPDQTENYKKLVAQIRWDQLMKCDVNSLTSTVLDMTVENKVHQKVPVKIERVAAFPPYRVQIGSRQHQKFHFDYFEEILDTFIEEGIIATTDLCESSIAEDFREYENLWD